MNEEKSEKLEELINKEYIISLHKCRTTWFQLIKLLILQRISWKYFLWFINNSPIKIYTLNKYGSISSEELLFSNSGLKLIAENIFLTWDKYIIFYKKDKTNYFKNIKV